ncbi:MAG TPA: hypothetical protein VGK41_09395, partial [Solirubrobacterales bacterium]
LARLRNIDLQAASDILGKVYGGNIGILSRYGIQIRKGATATEALAEITKLAAGQAEAFAETNEGKLLASQIKVGEALEKLGGRILPFVAAGTEAAADAVETLVLGFDGLADVLDIISTGKLPETEQEAHDLTDALLGMAGLLSPFGRQINEWGQDVADEMQRAAANADYMSDATKDDLRDVGAAAGAMADDVEDAGDDVEQSFRDILRAATETVQGLIDGYFDPIEERAGIYKSRMEQNAAEERLRNATTARETREASDDIVSAIEDQASSLVRLADQGALTAADVDRFEKDVKQSYRALGREVPKEIQVIIAKLRELDRWDGHTVTVNVRSRITGGNVGGKVVGDPRRATGGQVTRGTQYIWSEPRSPELFLPNVSGRIAAMPEIRAAVAQTSSGSATAGGDTVIITAPTVPTSVTEAAEQLARVRRLRS